MGNGGLASVGKILALAGFFSVVFGGFLYSLANPGELCGDILRPSSGPGCTTDYSSLILPTIVGAALLVTGAWLFWVFKLPKQDAPRSDMTIQLREPRHWPPWIEIAYLTSLLGMKGNDWKRILLSNP